MAAIGIVKRALPEGRRLVVLLGVLIVALGVFSVWSADRARGLTGTSAAENTALTDNARTSEVKGQVTSAVNTSFSYNYADVPKTEKAAQTLLTGKAVQQYNQMFQRVREQAGKQKLVLTTTVTDSGVKSIDGDRARLLVFADQRSTRTDKNETSYSAAVFAVGAIRVDGQWRIEDIDTFTA